jgi:hypothetical protein
LRNWVASKTKSLHAAAAMTATLAAALPYNKICLSDFLDALLGGLLTLTIKAKVKRLLFAIPLTGQRHPAKTRSGALLRVPAVAEGQVRSLRFYRLRGRKTPVPRLNLVGMDAAVITKERT